MNYLQKLRAIGFVMVGFGLPLQAMDAPTPPDAAEVQDVLHQPRGVPTLRATFGAAAVRSAGNGLALFEKSMRDHHRGKVAIGGLIALFAWWKLSADADKITKEIKRRTYYDSCSLEEQKRIDKKIAHALGWNSVKLRCSALAAGVTATGYGLYFSRNEIAEAVHSPELWRDIRRIGIAVIIQQIVAEILRAAFRA